MNGKSIKKAKETKPKAKKDRFRGRQVLVVGLVALVLAAGYYRWTLGEVKLEAVSVAGSSAPAEEAAFFSKDNKEQGEDEEKGEEQQENGNQEQAGVNVITRARQDRDKLRGETMDKWKEISSNKEATEAAKKEAEDNIVKLTKYSENENAIETNVKSKGFDDCFAQVGDSGVSVIVKGGNLESPTVAQIKDIIIGETGVSASQIKISSEQ